MPTRCGSRRKLGLFWRGCVYEPYTNFQDILPSPVNNSRVRMQCALWLDLRGRGHSEGWQLRALLLGLGQWDEGAGTTSRWTNHKAPISVMPTSLTTTTSISGSGCIEPRRLCGGNLPILGRFTTRALQYAPVRALASTNTDGISWITTHHVAEGTDPTNWDTDGDWMVDWFEVNDDEQDGSRVKLLQSGTIHANHVVTVKQTLDNPSSAG